MTLQQLMGLTRRAIERYEMIEEGDKIAVGLSGGKDSLALLLALKGIQRFYPKHFELEAITCDLGFGNFDTKGIQKFCEESKIKHTLVSTQIAQIVFENRAETNPCSLCAKLRKGAINDAVKEMGFHKVAFAHHKDDVIDTALMSLLYEGRFSCFEPKTYWDRSQITLIRPFIYVREADIKGFCNKYNLSIFKNPCPVDGNTKREYVKQLIKQLEKENLGTKERLFHAVETGNLSGWKMS